MASAYSGTYDSSDLSTIIIDFVGTYFVQLVAFAGLIALLGLYLWLKKGNVVKI